MKLTNILIYNNLNNYEQLRVIEKYGYGSEGWGFDSLWDHNDCKVPVIHIITGTFYFIKNIS